MVEDTKKMHTSFAPKNSPIAKSINLYLTSLSKKDQWQIDEPGPRTSDIPRGTGDLGEAGLGRWAKEIGMRCFREPGGLKKVAAVKGLNSKCST